MTPSLTSCSLNLPISVSFPDVGRTPASLSFVALTRTTNRIVTLLWWVLYAYVERRGGTFDTIPRIFRAGPFVYRARPSGGLRAPVPGAPGGFTSVGVWPDRTVLPRWRNRPSGYMQARAGVS